MASKLRALPICHGTHIRFLQHGRSALGDSSLWLEAVLLSASGDALGSVVHKSQQDPRDPKISKGT